MNLIMLVARIGNSAAGEVHQAAALNGFAIPSNPTVLAAANPTMDTLFT